MEELSETGNFLRVTDCDRQGESDGELQSW